MPKTFCEYGFGAMCDKCAHLHDQALKYAQRGGPAYAQQLYYEELQRLKELYSEPKEG